MTPLPTGKDVSKHTGRKDEVNMATLGEKKQAPMPQSAREGLLGPPQRTWQQVHGDPTLCANGPYERAIALAAGHHPRLGLCSPLLAVGECSAPVSSLSRSPRR